VELTVALHKIFDIPDDDIVFDVGHQGYVHKILTGRKDLFSTLRQLDGISGFPNPKESVYDSFIAGHASISISAALGIAKAKTLNKKKSHTVAVIGDGALTGGEAFEGLSNAGRSKENIIVILNDNEMSISKNVGGIAKYLSKIRTTKEYYRFKDRVYRELARIPFFGKKIVNSITLSNRAIKGVLYRDTMFEHMGFSYLGPTDGHDINGLCNTLERAKKLGRPVFIHVNTVKGKGYPKAEKNPGEYHGIGKFDAESGHIIKKLQARTFTSVFSKKMTELAKHNPKLCGITAAMTGSTGLTAFSEKYPNRFYDVGIAEQHAVTFAAGLAKGGALPVFCVYSSFLQRCYDQLIHDISLQSLKVIIAIDRAGITGDDGETHQGIFDTAMFMSIPSVKIYSPASTAELEYALDTAVIQDSGLTVVRYPKDCELPSTVPFDDYKNSCSLVKSKSKAAYLIVTYGRIFFNCLSAVNILEQSNINTDILKLNIIQPFDIDIETLKGYEKIIFVEEGIESGGVGSGFIERISNLNCEKYLHGIKGPLSHATISQLITQCKLDPEGIAEYILNI